jgi:hypothetical protein
MIGFDPFVTIATLGLFWFAFLYFAINLAISYNDYPSKFYDFPKAAASSSFANK